MLRRSSKARERALLKAAVLAKTGELAGATVEFAIPYLSNTLLTVPSAFTSSRMAVKTSRDRFRLLGTASAVPKAEKVIVEDPRAWKLGLDVEEERFLAEEQWSRASPAWNSFQNLFQSRKTYCSGVFQRTAAGADGGCILDAVNSAPQAGRHRQASLSRTPSGPCKCSAWRAKSGPKSTIVLRCTSTGVKETSHCPDDAASMISPELAYSTRTSGNAVRSAKIAARSTVGPTGFPV